MRVFDSIHDGQPVKIFAADSEVTLDQERRILIGRPIVYGVLSHPQKNGTRAKLLPGSARFGSQTFALRDHDFKKIIGNTENGTLKIFHDDQGAGVEIGPLPNTTDGNDTYELVKNKFVTGMSFMMKNWQSRIMSIDGQTVEVFSESSFDVPEVTVTGSPMFPQATVSTDDQTPDTKQKRLESRIACSPKITASTPR